MMQSTAEYTASRQSEEANNVKNFRMEKYDIFQPSKADMSCSPNLESNR